MLEVLMTKNENNSHAFLRKMVENIKQTKDAQCPDDAKANEVHKTLFGGKKAGNWVKRDNLNIVVSSPETVHRL